MTTLPAVRRSDAMAPPSSPTGHAYQHTATRAGSHLSTGAALCPLSMSLIAQAIPYTSSSMRPGHAGKARLTAWELGAEGVSHAIIADNATGHLMQRGEIDMVIVGSDRIAANGDVANKIGTYSSAVVAKANNIPFYVAAPTTTIDPQCPSGAQIPIEERSEDEVLYTWGWSDDGVFQRVRTAPTESSARNPAFDVTPAELVAGIITEKGIVPASPAGIASVARST